MKVKNSKMTYKSLLAYKIIQGIKNKPLNSRETIAIVLCLDSNQNELKRKMKPLENALKYLKINKYISKYKAVLGGQQSLKNSEVADYNAFWVLIQVSDIINYEKLKKLSEQEDWKKILEKKQKGKVESLGIIIAKRKIIINKDRTDPYPVANSRLKNNSFDKICQIAKDGFISYADSKDFVSNYKNFYDYFNGSTRCPIYSEKSHYYSKTKVLFNDKRECKIKPLISVKILKK